MNTIIKSFALQGSSQLARRALRLVDSWYGVLLVSGLFSFAMMYRYIMPLDGILYTEGAEGHDWGQMVWNLWFVNEAITAGHNPYFTNLLFYPMGANLAHHTLAAGFFPVTFLVKLFSRGDPLYPVYAYHIIILLCFTATLACSYFLLRELAATRLPAAIAACAYAFCDYYQIHTLHLNLLAGFFLPLSALFLVRAYKEPRSRNFIYAAMVSAAAVYFTEYALYLYLGMVVFASLLFLFRESRRSLIETISQVGVKRLAVAGALFLLLVIPFVVNFSRAHIIKPLPVESSVYSANVAAFFLPGTNHPLLNKVFGPLNARVTAGLGGYEAFLGFTLVIFAGLGFVITKNRLVRISGISAIVFYVLALGPTLKVLGSDTGIRLPYSLLMQIPPFAMGRTPVRFVAVASFFLMIVAATGIAWLHFALTRRLGRSWAMALMLTLLVVTVAGAYTRTYRRHSFVPPADLRARVAGPVFNVPLLGNDGYASLLQVFHQQPIATGYVARDSVETRNRFLELKRIYDHGGPEFCGRITALGFRNIVITGGEVVVPLELARCSIPVIDLRSDPSWLRSFPNFAGNDAPRFPDYTYGTTLDFGLAVSAERAKPAQDYLWYGWSGAEQRSRWTERGTAALTFSLSKVSDAVLHLRMAPFLAAGKLESQRVEVELNDQPVTSLSLSNGAFAEYEIILPLSAMREQNVLTFRLPDATSPQSLGVSEDTRLLGISVQRATISQNRLR
jgi:hypothetical protein